MATRHKTQLSLQVAETKQETQCITQFQKGGYQLINQVFLGKNVGKKRKLIGQYIHVTKHNNNSKMKIFCTYLKAFSSSKIDEIIWNLLS